MGKADLSVFFLDVGQGDCTFIVPPEGEGAPILFDCADELVASRFCTDHGITDLQAVVASHLDIDHVRGMLPFLKERFESNKRVERLLSGLTGTSGKMAMFISGTCFRRHSHGTRRRPIPAFRWRHRSEKGKRGKSLAASRGRSSSCSRITSTCKRRFIFRAATQRIGAPSSFASSARVRRSSSAVMRLSARGRRSSLRSVAPT